MGAPKNALDKIKGSIQEAAKKKNGVVTVPVADTEMKAAMVTKPLSEAESYLKNIKNFSDDNTLEGAKKKMMKYGFGKGGSGLPGSVTTLSQGETAPFQDATNKSVAYMQEIIGKAAKVGVKNKNEFLANYDMLSKGVGAGTLDDPNYKKYVPNFKQVAADIYDEQIKKYGGKKGK